MSSPEDRFDPTTLRHLLVERARARAAEQDDGGAESVEETEREAADPMEPSVDLIALHEAIEKMQQSNPRQARLVDLRFFGNRNVAETAMALGISEDTVRSDWKFARAWLNRELTRDKR